MKLKFSVISLFLLAGFFSTAVLYPESLYANTPFVIPLSTITNFTPQLTESSGVAVYDADRKIFLSHNDSGGKPRIYFLTLSKESSLNQHSIYLEGAANIDWEDMTSDGAGNFFVGDFGNNIGYRDMLIIYRFYIPLNLSESALLELKSVPVEPIFFRYDFPSLMKLGFYKRGLNCEALFYDNGVLYLLSKDKTVSHFFELVPQKGVSIARYLDSVFLGSPVTAVDFDPNRGLLVLTYRALYLFEGTSGSWTALRKSQVLCHKLPGVEAVCFLNSNQYLVTSEYGKLFFLSVDDFDRIGTDIEFVFIKD